jgi:hypothetical protein
MAGYRLTPAARTTPAATMPRAPRPSPQEPRYGIAWTGRCREAESTVIAGTSAGMPSASGVLAPRTPTRFALARRVGVAQVRGTQRLRRAGCGLGRRRPCDSRRVSRR